MPPQIENNVSPVNKPVNNEQKKRCPKCAQIGFGILVILIVFLAAMYVLKYFGTTTLVIKSVSNTFSYNAKPSDKVAGMTLEKISSSVNNDALADTDHVYAEFSGTITLTGILSAPTGNSEDGGMGPEYSLNNLTQDSLTKLPHLQSDTRIVWFGVKNPEIMKNFSVKNGDKVEMTINKYYYVFFPAGVWNYADVVSVKKITPPAQTSNSVGNFVDLPDWGISFVKSSDWNVTATTSVVQPFTRSPEIGEVEVEQMQLTQISGENKGDTITIQYINGGKITDSDAKFGDISYWSDKTNGKWMVEGINDFNAMDGPTSTREAVPQFTVGKIPVFLGRSRWLTYIMPLNQFLFLKLNITGSGATQPLTDLVKTIKETKSHCYECGI